MLACYRASTGERIEIDRNDTQLLTNIKVFSQDEDLYCPECNGLLNFKYGKIKVPHFAHVSKIECDYIYKENESVNHINGKLLLKEILKRNFPNAEIYLEYKIPQTGQRADVLIKHKNGEMWAFEIQYSKITSEEWNSRHQLYQSIGVKDFWILGSSVERKFESKVVPEYWYEERNSLLKFRTQLANAVSQSDNGTVTFVESSRNELIISYIRESHDKLYNEIQFKRVSNTVDADEITFEGDRIFFPEYSLYIKELEQRKSEKERIEKLRRQRKLEHKLKRKEARNKVEIYNQKISNIEMYFGLKIYQSIKCEDGCKGQLCLRLGRRGVYLKCDKCGMTHDADNEYFGTPYNYKNIPTCQKCMLPMQLRYVTAKSYWCWECSTAPCNNSLPIVQNINSENDFPKLKSEIKILISKGAINRK